MTYELRKPDYLDLAHDGWKVQPRAKNGQWSKTAGLAERAVGAADWHSQPKATKAAAKAVLLRERTMQKTEVTRTVVHVKEGHLTRAEARHLKMVTHEERLTLYKESGVLPQYPEIPDEDLIDKWHTAPEGTVKSELEAEVKRRLAVLHSAAAVFETDAKDAARGPVKDFAARFDARLAKSKPGQAVLRIRDRLLKDKTLDRAEAAKEKTKELGKEYLSHGASQYLTLGGIALLLGPITHAAVGLLGENEAAIESIHSFIENPAIHTGLATAAAIGVAAAGNLIHRARVKAKARKARKVQPKVRV